MITTGSPDRRRVKFLHVFNFIATQGFLTYVETFKMILINNKQVNWVAHDMTMKFLNRICMFWNNRPQVHNLNYLLQLLLHLCSNTKQ